ncbi:MAG TPA: hypothetical protein VJI98_04465 [Candidatus Nanoarchaeia archaeon]|nr:hypothetical protein [Candidatus Nanoarchaeia archaeon]
MSYTNEHLLEAREELKRLEHIIYVSLKYTRTVDVIKNALKRMVEMFDIIIEAFLEKAKEEGRIDQFPRSPAFRATKVKELFPNDITLLNYLNFYSFLKTLLKLPSQKREEFRRHVTLIVKLDNSTAEVNIDNLVNCERYVHSFLQYARNCIEGKQEDD